MSIQSIRNKPRHVIEPYSWVGHLPFAMWLMATFRPKTVVELGVHTGNSFFAMSQSAVEAGLDCKLHGIDTWEGEQHAGYYDQSVYNRVELISKTEFPNHAVLHRKYFDEALSSFDDGSVDLLHIDGLHTYEAVRHDFLTWLPKLSQRCLVLFHDTQVRTSDFGVYKFWQELSQQYVTLEFEQSHGLGVLAVGFEAEAFVKDLMFKKSEMPSTAEFFAHLGSNLSAKKDLQANLQAGLTPTQSLLQIFVALNSPGNYSEQNTKNVVLEYGEPEEISWAMTQSEQLINQKIFGIRLDPGSKTSLVEVSNIRLIGLDGFVIWQPSAGASFVKLSDLWVLKSPVSTDIWYFICRGNDPHLELAIPDEIQPLPAGVRLQLTVAAHDAASFSTVLMQNTASWQQVVEQVNKDWYVSQQTLTLTKVDLQQAWAISDSLHKTIASLNTQNQSLSLQNSESLTALEATKALVSQREGVIHELTSSLKQAELSINSKVAETTELLHQNQRLQHEVDAWKYTYHDLQRSTSWRITQPLRSLSSATSKLKKAVNAIRGIVRQQGGLVNTSVKSMRILGADGPRGLVNRLKVFHHRQRSHQASIGHSLVDSGVVANETTFDYAEWVKRYDTIRDSDRTSIRNRLKGFCYKPVISVIMPVYNPPHEFFRYAIESVIDQLYPHWELCITDDASTDSKVKELIQEYCARDKRIKAVFHEKNTHIAGASNSALSLATGEYIAMLDQDDLIPEHALFLVVDSLQSNLQAKFIYSDQDKIDVNGLRYDPYFKPDFNLDLLRSQNYVDHLAVFKRSLIVELGGWRSEFNGSQDYDLVLRVIECASPAEVIHVPHVLYHWRAIPGSLAIDPGAKNYAALTSRAALADHVKRQGLNAKVSSNYPNLSIHRLKYDLPVDPLVTFIVPTKDEVEILRICINGVLSQTAYKNIELLIVNNRSVDQSTYDFFEKISSQDQRVKVLTYDAPFNYSAINNFAAKQARGEVLCLLNNDIEIMHADWLHEMVGHAMRKEIGAVGARLYYPDRTVQHAGVLLGYKGRAGHMYRYSPPEWLGYWARSVLTQNLTAVTAACMVLRKSVFDAVGGFNEKDYSVTFNDVDICLRIHEAGWRNVYTPHAELIHHESKTRGMLAYIKEEDHFSNEWQKYIKHDPAYNPNLSLASENFDLAFPPRVIKPWKQLAAVESGSWPLVSIITRTYGERSEFLRAAMQSVFEQSYRPLEWIVVEDGGLNKNSPLKMLIESVATPKGISIKYCPMPKVGRCAVGNQGLSMVAGEFFCFLDDDDMLMPNHVATLVNALLNTPDVMAAYTYSKVLPTNVLSVSPLKLQEGKAEEFGRHPWNLASLWNYNFIAIQSLLIRHHAFEKYGGFVVELDCLEDWDLWLRYSSEQDFMYVDELTSIFRMPKDTNILESRRQQHLSYLPKLRHRQAELLHKHSASGAFKRLQAASKYACND